MTEQLVRSPASFYKRNSIENVRYPVVMSENDRVWLKYCGFLDLDLQQFMSIQESLLLQQLEKVAPSALGRKLIGDRIPINVEEYRRLVHLTDYEDYLPELNSDKNTALPQEYYIWASTSGGADDGRRVPYTLEAYNRALDNLMAVFILACSQQRGQSSLIEGDRVLYNVDPPPFLSGILASGASRVFNLRSVLPPDMPDSMDFLEKITKGFEMSLQTGVDIIIAMTSILVKTGSEFNQISKKSNLYRHLMHPGELMRVIRAFLRSKLENRNILPRDLWPVKALIGWGIDTSIYRDLVYKYWGAYPYEFHACPEAGIIAIQSWTRRGMTFVPHSNFYEFIPESEWLKSRQDIFYEPHTVLLSEVKPGERYELVISSFCGMPFMRYRLGHLVRITALEDADAEIHLPQMVFEARADDLIDIAGFTRVSEKTVTQAIASASIDCEDWIIRKEIREGKPALHLYIELTNGSIGTDLGPLLHSEMMKADPGYHDLAAMREIRPMQITVLRPGAFKDYYNRRQPGGSQIAQRRPPRVNASDDILAGLLRPGDKPELPLADGGILSRETSTYLESQV